MAKHPLTCSVECMAILRAEIYKGESNPNYNNRGEGNPLFKGGRRITNFGYVVVYQPNHPYVRSDGYVLEHRLIAEQFLLLESYQYDEIHGIRYLKPEIHVHHIDGDKLNNIPKNLELLSPSNHMKLHHKMRKNLV